MSRNHSLLISDDKFWISSNLYNNKKYKCWGMLHSQNKYPQHKPRDSLDELAVLAKYSNIYLNKS